MSMYEDAEDNIMASSGSGPLSGPLWDENSIEPPADNFIDVYRGLNYFMQVLFGLVCVVGLVGNILVIYVVLRNPKMRTVANVYILNLSLGDVFFQIFIPIEIISYNMGQWIFGNDFCRLYMLGVHSKDFVHTIFLAIMIADIYVATCHPRWASRVRSPLVSKLVSCSGWVASGLLVMPIIMYSSLIEDQCFIIWPDGEFLKGHHIFTIYTFNLGYFIPFLLISVFCILVICGLREERSRQGNDATDLNDSPMHIFGSTGDGSGEEQQHQSHREEARLVLVVVAVYFVCELPKWVMILIGAITEPAPFLTFITITMLASCLAFATSAINPILYAFLSKSFKKSFARVGRCTAPNVINTETPL